MARITAPCAASPATLRAAANVAPEEMPQKIPSLRARALGGGRENHLRPQQAHDLAALDRERLGHGGDERITLGRAHHGERDAGVARGGLDHRLAGLERTAALGVLDDGDREAVLDGGERIEELALHVHGDVPGREALDSDDRGPADGAEYVVVDHDVPSTLPLIAPTRIAPASA